MDVIIIHADRNAFNGWERWNIHILSGSEILFYRFKWEHIPLIAMMKRSLARVYVAKYNLELLAIASHFAPMSQQL
jgi:hypothetical protein